MRQPKALAPLFLTEMWERFGYYIISSLLIFYLVNQLRLSDAQSFTLLSEFTALVYIAPLACGFFSDRLLGPRYSILIGAGFLGVGYLLLAVNTHTLLFLSLSIVVIGNGLLKPNISSFLGEFYYENDPRRDAGFTLFYMGINLGALIAISGSGFIQETMGWKATFIAAAIGMVLAFGSFFFGFKSYENRGLPLSRRSIKSKLLRLLSWKINTALLLLACIAVAYGLLKSANTAEIIQAIVGVLTLIGLVILAFRYEKPQRNKFLVLIILILASVVFWGLFFQVFSAVNLFTERDVYRSLFNVLIPPNTFIALESIFILILGPFLAWLWQTLHVKKRDPTPGMKFSLAMLFVAIAMWVLVLAIHFHRPDGLINPGWILVFYIFLTVGEMLLSPIGLSMVTELSPPRLSGFMMGIWFMALGFGGELSGFLSKQASIPQHTIDIQAANQIYAQAFFRNGLLSLIVFIILLALSPWLKRLTRS